MVSLTIKQKLYGVVGLVFTLIVFLLGALYYGNATNKEVRGEDQRVTAIQQANALANIAMLQARRNEKDFLLRKDAKYVDKHRQTMQILYKHLQVLGEQTRNQNARAAVDELNKQSRAYEASFQAMVEAQTRVGLDEKSGLLGSLRNSVHDVEDTLKKFNNDTLAVKMLMMRRHEKDYLAREKDKYVGEMAKRKSEFETLLAKSSIPAASKKTIAANMNSYHADFNALVAGMKEVDKQIAILREQIHATEPAFDQINNVVDNLSTEISEYGENANNRVALAQLLTMSIGGLVFLVSVLLIAVAITRGLDEAVRVCKDVASGKLGLGIQPKSNDEIGQLLSSLKFMDENLTRVVTEVQSSVTGITSASKEIASGNSSLSQRTEEQASSLEETASSMEEMTGTVKQNADSAAEARQVAEANRQKAASGAEIVAQTVNAMGDINQSSSRIADIIGTIDGIAFQTNLLALNAAVEAARAGDQGRGFAVVASEVRNLAQRSADAAKEIKGLIEDSVSKVKAGTSLVDASGKTLEEIIEGIKKVADIVAEISASSQEQASGIDQVNNAVAQMDSMTQDNAALVEEAAAASRSLQEQSENLQELIGFFRLNGQHALDEERVVAEISGGNSGNRRSLEEIKHSRVAPQIARTHLDHLRKDKAVASKQDSSEWEQF